MMSESFENWWRHFEWCVRNTKKVWSCNKFKKIKCQCNRWVLVRNPDTSKEIVQFVHSESFENWWRHFEWCVRNTKKVWSCNKFKKIKCQCNRWVLVRNPDTSKEIVQFVHEVRPVFAVTLSTLLHMLCGWNDDTMPSFNIFRVKCWKLMASLWMVRTERKKSLEL